jgi:hypothetical protein
MWWPFSRAIPTPYIIFIWYLNWYLYYLINQETIRACCNSCGSFLPAWRDGWRRRKRRRWRRQRNVRRIRMGGTATDTCHNVTCWWVCWWVLYPNRNISQVTLIAVNDSMKVYFPFCKYTVILFLVTCASKVEPWKLRQAGKGMNFPCQSSFHQLLHNHPHLSSGACTIGQ